MFPRLVERLFHCYYCDLCTHEILVVAWDVPNEIITVASN